MTSFDDIRTNWQAQVSELVSKRPGVEAATRAVDAEITEITNPSNLSGKLLKPFRKASSLSRLERERGILQDMLRDGDNKIETIALDTFTALGERALGAGALADFYNRCKHVNTLVDKAFDDITTALSEGGNPNLASDQPHIHDLVSIIYSGHRHRRYQEDPVQDAVGSVHVLHREIAGYHGRSEFVKDIAALPDPARFSGVQGAASACGSFVELGYYDVEKNLPATAKALVDLGNALYYAMNDILGEAVLAASANNPELVTLTADLRDSLVKINKDVPPGFLRVLEGKAAVSTAERAEEVIQQAGVRKVLADTPFVKFRLRK